MFSAGSFKTPLYTNSSCEDTALSSTDSSTLSSMELSLTSTLLLIVCGCSLETTISGSSVSTAAELNSVEVSFEFSTLLLSLFAISPPVQDTKNNDKHNNAIIILFLNMGYTPLQFQLKKRKFTLRRDLRLNFKKVPVFVELKIKTFHKTRRGQNDTPHFQLK